MIDSFYSIVVILKGFSHSFVSIQEKKNCSKIANQPAAHIAYQPL